MTSSKPNVERLCATAWIAVWFLGLSVAGSAPVSAEGEWPQWRGPNRDGVITQFAAPQTWPDSLKRVWKVPVGTGHASPIVDSGQVYLHSRQDDQEVASCLSLESGEFIWRKRYPAPHQMNSAATGHGKGPKSTPVLHNGKLYTLGISGILSCFEAATGDLKWRKEFSSTFDTTSPLYGTAMSPLVADDMLIAHVGGHDRGTLAAYDGETGEVKWRWDGDGPGYTSPIIVEFEGVRQLVTQTQNYCVGVALDTGHRLWDIPYTTPWDQNAVTPVALGEMVIFSGLDKGTTAVKPTEKGDTWSAEQIWHNAEISMYMSSPVLSDSLLFGLDHKHKGRFFCLNARTGSTLWTSEGRQTRNAAIIDAGEVLFFLTTDAELIVAKKGAVEFEPIARYTVADSPTWAHPVILGKRILIKDLSTLALLSLK